MCPFLHNLSGGVEEEERTFAALVRWLASLLLNYLNFSSCQRASLSLSPFPPLNSPKASANFPDERREAASEPGIYPPLNSESASIKQLPKPTSSDKHTLALDVVFGITGL